MNDPPSAARSDEEYAQKKPLWQRKMKKIGRWEQKVAKKALSVKAAKRLTKAKELVDEGLDTEEEVYSTVNPFLLPLNFSAQMWTYIHEKNPQVIQKTGRERPASVCVSAPLRVPC